MNAKYLSSLAALFLAAPMFACSASTEEADEPAASDDAAISAANQSCGAAKYNEALAFYKKAVDGANARSRAEMCDWTSDDAYKYEIANNAHKAVNTCAAFKNVIKTSQYAGKLRDALKDNLSYRILTGDLDSATWRTLETALVGVQMQGGMGHSDYWHLEFKAGNIGTMTAHEWTEEEDKYVDHPIAWGVVQRGGQTYVVVSGMKPPTGTVVRYEYLIKKDVSEGNTNITLERQGDSNDAFPATQTFYDIEGECGG